MTSAQTTVVPTRDWTPFEVRVSEDEIANPPFLITRLYSGSPGTIEIRSLRLRSLAGPSPRTPRPARQELLSGNPVLLAHVAVALATALLAIAGLSAAGLIGILSTIFVALAAGSRGALAVVSLWSLLVLLSPTGRRTWKIAAVLIIVGLGLGAALLAQDNRSEALEAAPSRVSIWGLALNAFQTHPLFGLEGAGARTADYFQQRTSSAANHAHNLVLQYAASYGVFGALAALLVLLGILALAYRYGGSRGLVILLPLAALNMVDATLFDARILVGTSFAINALAFAHSRPRRDDAEQSLNDESLS